MDIENARQNHPELVVRDMVALCKGECYTEPRHLDHLAGQVRRILKWRGVTKWLRVRRLLIKLKIRWLEKINTGQVELLERKAKAHSTGHPGDWAAYHHLRGYLKAWHEARAQVRVLCHSSRDIEPPRHPREWGDLDVLPSDLPDLPDKRWLKRRDELIGGGILCAYCGQDACEHGGATERYMEELRAAAEKSNSTLSPGIWPPPSSDG